MQQSIFFPLLAPIHNSKDKPQLLDQVGKYKKWIWFWDQPLKALNLVDGEFSKPTFQAYASNKDFRELPFVFPLAKVL